MNKEKSNELYELVYSYFENFYFKKGNDLGASVGRVLYELENDLSNKENKRIIYQALYDVVSEMVDDSKNKQNILKYLKEMMQTYNPTSKESILKNKAGCYALHVALSSSKLRAWQNKVLRYIDDECADKWRFPSTDFSFMFIRTLKLHFPEWYEELKGKTENEVREIVEETIYPLEINF